MTRKRKKTRVTCFVRETWLAASQLLHQTISSARNRLSTETLNMEFYKHRIMSHQLEAFNGFHTCWFVLKLGVDGDVWDVKDVYFAVIT